jgi:Icc-related predicted phosphoesterase
LIRTVNQESRINNHESTIKNQNSPTMFIGAVADIHGNFEALARAMLRHPDVPYWICVGDLASRTGAYPEPPAPLFWIKGNNEDFDRIAAWEHGAEQPRNLHYIRNGTAVTVGPLRIAGLGGTFAPTWFDTRATDLPHTPRDDKRRHFVREEADACKELSGIDILMTHEAARPFILVDESAAAGARPRRRDAGKPAINEVIAALRPRLHLCGHHHRFAETIREGVQSVCIDRINRAYLLIDAGSLRYDAVGNAA